MAEGYGVSGPEIVKARTLSADNIVIRNAGWYDPVVSESQQMLDILIAEEAHQRFS